MLDGTWNDPESGRSDTNIVRLRELIAENLEPRPSSLPIGIDSGSVVSPRYYSSDGKTWREHLVFYERGVGTGGFLDNLRGGGFGAGLARNIRRAYKFLSRHYSSGDQVFIFGFSRGAFTARSLTGYIGAAGLLKSHCCTTSLESKAWYYYRVSPNDRVSSVWDELRPNTHDPPGARIECLGVFDTVGALGVPVHYLWRENRDLFEFHDVEISSVVNRNLQALAVDEHRESFRPSIWRTPKFKDILSKTEQVWFPGSHSDVGGGYIDESTRAVKHPYALDDISLDWMLHRLVEYYPDFPIAKKAVERQFGPLWATAAHQHESRTGLYRITPKAWRSIGNQVVSCRGFNTNVGWQRHAGVLNEQLHISVLERLGCRVRINNLWRRYIPRNLIALLDRLEDSYRAGQSELLVVNWTRKTLSPAVPDDRELVLGVIVEARKRLQTS